MKITRCPPGVRCPRAKEETTTLACKVYSFFEGPLSCPLSSWVIIKLMWWLVLGGIFFSGSFCYSPMKIIDAFRVITSRVNGLKIFSLMHCWWGQ